MTRAVPSNQWAARERPVSPSRHEVDTKGATQDSASGVAMLDQRTKEFVAHDNATKAATSATVALH